MTATQQAPTPDLYYWSEFNHWEGEKWKCIFDLNQNPAIKEFLESEECPTNYRLFKATDEMRKFWESGKDASEHGGYMPYLNCLRGPRIPPVRKEHEPADEHFYKMGPLDWPHASTAHQRKLDGTLAAEIALLADTTPKEVRRLGGIDN